MALKNGTKEKLGSLILFQKWCSALLDTSKEKADIESLSLDSTLVLAYFVKYFYNKKCNCFIPIENSAYQMGANQYFFERILINFLNEVIVVPSPKNSIISLEKFKKEQGERLLNILMMYNPHDLAYIDCISVTMKELIWETNLDTEQIKMVSNHRIQKLPYDKIAVEHFKIWQQFIVDDCLAFTSQNCERLVNQKLNTTIYWIQLFKVLAEQFSLGQIFKIIYQCSSYSLRILHENGISSNTYQQILLESVQKYSQKVLANNWNIVPFEKRPKFLPQSALSKIYFEEILHYKEDPTNKKLSMRALNEMIDNNLS